MTYNQRLLEQFTEMHHRIALLKVEGLALKLCQSHGNATLSWITDNLFIIRENKNRLVIGTDCFEFLQRGKSYKWSTMDTVNDKYTYNAIINTFSAVIKLVRCFSR